MTSPAQLATLAAWFGHTEPCPVDPSHGWRLTSVRPVPETVCGDCEQAGVRTVLWSVMDPEYDGGQ